MMKEMMGDFRKVGIVEVALMMILTAVLMGVSEAQICNMTSEGLMACKPSVTASNPVPPSQLCCSALSHADMHCLCSYKNSKLLATFGIDINLAMQLPKKCNLPQPNKC